VRPLIQQVVLQQLQLRAEHRLLPIMDRGVADQGDEGRVRQQ
jgi:hypothetical protein